MTEQHQSPLNFSDNQPSTKSKKTWGREVACVLLVFCMYLAYSDRIDALEIMFFPTIAFAIPVFGIKSDVVIGVLNARKSK